MGADQCALGILESGEMKRGYMMILYMAKNERAATLSIGILRDEGIMDTGASGSAPWPEEICDMQAVTCGGFCAAVKVPFQWRPWRSSTGLVWYLAATGVSLYIC